MMQKRSVINRKRMEEVMAAFLVYACHDDTLRFTVEPYFVKNISISTGRYFYRTSKNMTLHYNEDCLFDNTKDGIPFVMADMNKRNKIMRGFSRITKILLHELGHLATCHEVFGEHGEHINEIMLQKTLCVTNSTYVQIADEKAATEWAFKWLADPENRAAAKRFEKHFWACFAEV